MTNIKSNKSSKKLLSMKLLALIVIVFVGGCQGQQADLGNSDIDREVEEGLVLSNATLEQSNHDGQSFWRLQVEKITYSQDNKMATIEGITGNLLENGEIVLKISAQRGEVINDGEKIYLQGEILAVDSRNDIEIMGEKLDWKPEENYLLMTENIEVNHTQLRLTTEEAKYYTNAQILELNNDIIANTQEPRLNLKTNFLVWQIEEEKVSAPEPITIDRYEDEAVTDRLSAERGEIDLEKKIVVFIDNINYQSLSPQIQGSAREIVWDYENRIVETDQMIQLVQLEENITMKGNSGRVDLTENKAYLQNSIYGEAAQDEAKIYADSVVWNLDNQNIDARGNVFYQQLNPPFNFRGDRAEGRLQDKMVKVTGNRTDKVVTTIYTD